MTKRVTEAESNKPEPRGEPIHVKYRPKRLKDVLGQGATAKSLEAILRGRSVPHCYLFTGPAGTGKTTLARIVADTLGIAATGIIEVDAALKTGVDDMRELTAGLRYNGFGDTPYKAIILNECHRLSAQAWDSLLMSTEEPPAHVFWFFTSTDPSKIPKAMLTRCTTYGLAPLRYDDLLDLLDFVCEEEGYPTTKKARQLVANAAQGSARQALTLLAKCHAAEDEEEVRVLLEVADENEEAIELARKLVKGTLEWDDITQALKSLEEQNIQPEGVRLMVVNYLNRVILGAKGKEAPRLLDMQAPFLKPAIGPEKWAPLLQAFGRHLWP